MKMTYKVQLWLSVAIILAANILSTLLKHWVWRSLGFVACGLLFILHPVLPKSLEPTRKNLLWVRIAGVILILIGVFTRVYTY